ncbi:pfs domain-containing protein [Fusarium phyllophilum]|uniref:Pfs domain-containing protein n=1 Tax=Fusarium phyllophilum TaxID=47803 RepID=A0A8H5IED7_9HYPO|nr:pfs domain-containing protein [Fusarium phyllophilum]
MNLDFRSATESDCYGILAKLMKYQQQMTIVLEVGVLRNKFREADTWAAGFFNLIQQLQGKKCVKVMILTGRTINADDNSIVTRIAIGSVPTKGLPPTATRHPMRSTVGQRSPQTAVTGYHVPSLTSSILEGRGPASASKPVTEIASPTEVASSKVQHSNDPSGQKPSDTDDMSMNSLTECLSKTLGVDQGSESNSSKRVTEKWFKMQEKTSHEFMYKEDFQSKVPVKIAVLDTGFAYTNSEDKRALKPYYQRIKKYANFIEGGSDAEAKMDPAGHGTAVAVQILRVSLKAVLYICRAVSPNRGPDRSAVEKAIRKAAAKPDKDSPDGGGWGLISSTCRLTGHTTMKEQPPLNKSPSLQTYLQEMPEMLALLRSSSSEKGPEGIKFLTPWKLIGKPGEERQITALFIIDD